MALKGILPEIHAAGSELVTLSPQLPQYSQRWVEEDGIDFPIVPDLGLGVARTYGLAHGFSDELRELYLGTLKLDMSRFNGDESWELPLPAGFVIDGGGIIRWRSVDPDYTVRPEPEEVLEAVRAL